MEHINLLSVSHPMPHSITVSCRFDIQSMLYQINDGLNCTGFHFYRVCTGFRCRPALRYFSVLYSVLKHSAVYKPGGQCNQIFPLTFQPCLGLDFALSILVNKLCTVCPRASRQSSLTPTGCAIQQ